MVVPVLSSELKDGVEAFLRRTQDDPEWGWIDLFTDGNYEAFKVELALMANDPDLTPEKFAEEIDAWKATAEVDGNPEALAAIARARAGLKNYRPLSDFLKT